MNISTGWSPPCTSSRHSIITYHRACIDAEQYFVTTKVPNKYIQLSKLFTVIFYRFFNGNLVFCLKLVEQRYTGSDRFVPVNAVMKGLYKVFLPES